MPPTLPVKHTPIRILQTLVGTLGHPTKITLRLRGSSLVSLTSSYRGPKPIILYSKKFHCSIWGTWLPSSISQISLTKLNQLCLKKNVNLPEFHILEKNKNIRMVVKAINRIFQKNELLPLPYLCRELCSQVMCNSSHVSCVRPCSTVTRLCIKSV